MASNTVTNAESILVSLRKTQDATERARLAEEFVKHPHLAGYQLSSDDLPLIKLGWTMSTKKSRDFSFNACVTMYSRYDRTPKQVQDIIQSLITRRIIAPIDVTDMDAITETDGMLTADYALCDSFRYQLKDFDPLPRLKAVLPGSLSDCATMINAINDTFAKINDMFWEAGNSYNTYSDNECLFYLYPYLQPLVELLITADMLKPVQLIKQAKLTNIEISILLFMLYKRQSDLFILSRVLLSKVMSCDFNAYQELFPLFSDEGALVGNNFIVECTDLNPKAFKGCFRLSNWFRSSIELDE